MKEGGRKRGMERREGEGGEREGGREEGRGREREGGRSVLLNLL